MGGSLPIGGRDGARYRETPRGLVDPDPQLRFGALTLRSPRALPPSRPSSGKIKIDRVADELWEPLPGSALFVDKKQMLRAAGRIRQLDTHDAL